MTGPHSLPLRWGTGAAPCSLTLPVPPARMALARGGRPLKRWRYVAVYRPDVMLCVGDARVAGIRQRWWAVALPDGSLLEGARGVRVRPGRTRASTRAPVQRGRRRRR